MSDLNLLFLLPLLACPLVCGGAVAVMWLANRARGGKGSESSSMDCCGIGSAFKKRKKIKMASSEIEP